MASIITTSWSALTESPFATFTSLIVPVIGATTSPDPAAGAAAAGTGAAEGAGAEAGAAFGFGLGAFFSPSSSLT